MAVMKWDFGFVVLLAVILFFALVILFCALVQVGIVTNLFE